MSLSIIMPTYNDGRYIRQALNAILNQTFTNFELIIINDASTDDTAAIINEYCSDSRIKYLENDVNLGVVKTINRGCRLATGDYIVTLSSDDYIDQGFFKRGIEHLQRHPDKGMCFFDIVHFEGHVFERALLIPEFIHATPLSPEEMFEIHKKHNFFIPACASIVKKSELEKKGYFSPELGYFCDFVLFTLIGLEAGAIYVPEVGTFFRILPKSESRHADITRKKMVMERHKILNHLKNDRKSFRLLCYSTALARVIPYYLYTMFLRPKYWNMALPMIWVKFKLMFTKKKRRARLRTSLWTPQSAQQEHTQGRYEPIHNSGESPD